MSIVTVISKYPGALTLELMSTYKQVYDGQGVGAFAHRRVTVKAACPKGEQLCRDQLSCSNDGICLNEIGGTAPVENPVDLPPVLILRTTAALHSFVSVRQFSKYTACATNQLPTKDALYALLMRQRFCTSEL